MSPDPYKYFRIEARELVTELGKHVLALEKESVSPARIAQLLRLAHTLKGAARVVKQREIADHAHALEDALTPHRETGGPLPRSGFDLVLALIDQMGARVTALDQPAAPAGGAAAEEAPRPRPAEETFRTLRAEIAEVDDLLDGITEVQTLLAHLGRNLDGLTRMRRLADSLAVRIDARHADGSGRNGQGALSGELMQACLDLDRTLVGGIEQLDRQLREVRQSAERIRLIAASVLFTPLERAVRDVASAQGKQVEFEAAGGDLRLDAHVLGVIQPALVQMMRNAVAHGIEVESERRAAGKPPRGKVRLEIVRRGQRVAFVVKDDGRGVDFQAVRRIAADKGLGDAAQLAPEALLQRLLAGGISTSGTVSEMAGRGIGLDVVREAKERLGGEVAVRTEAGRGTAVEVEVPISLASLEALLVETAGATVAIPLDAVRSCLRVPGNQLARSGRGDTVVHGDRVLPFLPLARVLTSAANALRRPDTWSAVLIQATGGMAAIGVDRLLGTQQVVLRPLPESCPASPVVAGATVDTEGNPRLVLDPDSLLAEALRAEAPAERQETARLPILVIDDSLTTRMLEQSILESAGFDVEVAVSAEDGLERARRERFALFLVDVEMPGMDGFSFVAETRADPALRDIPAILVTSRNAPEDFKRGEEVGARGYMVKSEFNQGALLERIRTLMA